MIFWLKGEEPIKIGIVLKITHPKFKNFEINKFVNQGKVLLNDEPVFDVDKLIYEEDVIRFRGNYIKLKLSTKEIINEEPLGIIKHKSYRNNKWEEHSKAKDLDLDIERLSMKLHKILKNSSKTISFAESCTGGLLQEIITRYSGSSKYFLGGVVSYSIDSKIKLLNVKQSTLQKFGAVSEATAKEMVYGLFNLFFTNISISVTGIAGPTGGSKEKPVGTVHFAILLDKTYYHKKLHLNGKRDEIRKKTAIEIYKFLIKLLSKETEKTL